MCCALSRLLSDDSPSKYSIACSGAVETVPLERLPPRLPRAEDASRLALHTLDADLAPAVEFAFDLFPATHIARLFHIQDT